MARTLKTGGGGATLYTLKIRYKIFGIQIFSKNVSQVKICEAKSKLTPIYIYDFMAEYVATNPNIQQEISNLISGLSKENQAFVLRQIGRFQKAHQNKDYVVRDLTAQELREWQKIHDEFIPYIYQLDKNLYAYKHYLLPTRIFELSVFWHKHSLSVLEPQTLAKMRQKDFIDVGGFVGDSAMIFEQEFCDKNIYTFEPTTYNYNRMLKTIKLNNLKRVIPINKGLGAENSKMEIGISKNDGLGSSIGFLKFYNTFESNEFNEFVEITTLDEFVRENKIEVGFIKVDIEGFEMEFLKGAKETICSQKPAMLLSIYHQASDYFGIKPLIESWNLGYTFKIHQGIDYSIPVETALFCEVLE